MSELEVAKTKNSAGAAKLWLAAMKSVPQLMIVLNGLVLTITAFFATNFFISRIEADHYAAKINAARSMLVEQMSTIDRTFMTTSMLLELYDAAKDKNIKNYLGMVDVDRFVELIWFPADMGSDPIVIKANNETLWNAQPKKEELRSLIDLSAGKSKRLIVDDTFFGSVSTSKPVQSVLMPFAIVRPVTLNGKTMGTLIGVASFEKFAQTLWFDQENTISRIMLTHFDDNKLLYEMNKNPEMPKTAYSEKTKINFLGDTFEAHLFVNPAKQFQVLKVIPWLILAFGFVLTVFFWFAVWNNQQRAVRLAEMNKSLAEKNKELNAQNRERERLFQALRKAERENSAIINSVSDIIFEISPAGEILFLNDSWARITGASIEQTLGRNFFDLIYPQDQEEQRKNVLLLLRGQKQAYRVLTRIREAGGNYRAVELAISMIRQDENKNTRIVGGLTDIEERQRAEKALNETERRYRTIWENSASGIYQMTADGQLLSANPAMAKFFGYASASEMMAEVKNANQQLFANPQERMQFLRQLSNETQATAEFMVYTKAGNKIWISENSRAVKDEEGQLLYFESSFQDVTERKESDINLREAKLQSDLANRAKSEFLANMSHELRTPLNSIIGFSEIIKNEVFGQVQPRPYWDYARDIYDSGRHLLGIINQILDIARIDAGERELNESVVDLPRVVGICTELLSPKIKEGNVILSNLVDVRLPRVIAEEVAVKQILVNLISNAVKYTPENGRVTISSEIEATGNIRISVTDTGVGLDEKEIEKALSPFGVVDGRLSKTSSGIGLGLSLVNSLMKLHGGRLEIFSQKGIGTTASIVFPSDRIDG